MKPKPPTEKIITANIKRFLKFIGFFHWKVWQGLGSAKGVSDIIGIKTYTIDELIKMEMSKSHADVKRALNTKVGVFVAIEVKTAKGKLSDHQRNFLKSVQDAGGIAIMARKVEDVEGLK